MNVELCKWKYGKEAPLVLMIDDFANKYMIDHNNGDYLGSDWGGRCKNQNSLYDFLEKKIFSVCPELKVTMFLVVGRRENLIPNGKKSYSMPINESKEYAAFLKELCHDERFEIAYHGLNHGQIINGFLKQEWTCFKTLREANETIRRAVSIYKETTDSKLYGGKYCGYEYNEFSDQSIMDAGFEWWCRHWDGDIFLKRGKPEYSLEMSKFGEVVDIPSTVDGSIFSIRNIKTIFTKGFFKGWYYRIKYGVILEKILDQLVSDSNIINIQEHSSPIREDEKRQQPNIIDDVENVIYILDYVKKYDIWFATCHEIADYYNAICMSELSFSNNVITINFKGKKRSEICFVLSNDEYCVCDDRVVSANKNRIGTVYTVIVDVGINIFKLKRRIHNEV